jgi:hypothetical protein
MLPDLRKTIACLNDWQTIACCRVLVVLLDEMKAREPNSGRPAGLTITDFNQWVQIGGSAVQPLVRVLCGRGLAITAAAGRRLMQTCLRWGYKDQVLAACRLAHAPVDSLGMLSPVTIVASLATVMLWGQDRPNVAALLQPEPTGRQGKRRYAWFQAPPVEKRATVLAHGSSQED